MTGGDAALPVGRRQHDGAAHVLSAAAFREDRQADPVAGGDIKMDQRRRVVAGVLAAEGVGDDGPSQVSIGVPAANPRFDRVVQGAAGDVRVLSQFDEHDGGAGVLTDRDDFPSGQAVVLEDLGQHLSPERRSLALRGGGDRRRDVGAKVHVRFHAQPLRRRYDLVVGNRSHGLPRTPEGRIPSGF
jgi:hypothetical protein